VTEHVGAEHLRRASSFGSQASAYARHRPDYPSAAIEWSLGELSPGPRQVLDLAAGTGKLTEGIRGLGHHVVAVEPDESMRNELIANLPSVTVLAGTAERIPLPDAAVDAVLVGQAFHWFDADRALPEIARVLRPGGVLAALWNYQDEAVDWVAGFLEAKGNPQSWSKRYRGSAIPPHPAFHDEVSATFEHTQRRTAQSLLETAATHSHLLVLDEQGRSEALSRIESYLRTCPHTSGGEFDLPLRTTTVRMVRR
jgi:SAM-dependent methyltransferase